MNNLFVEYEKRHLLHLAKIAKLILAAYEHCIAQLSLKTITYRRFKDKETLSIDKIPGLEKLIMQHLHALSTKIYTITINGTTTAWDLSNEKNNLIVDKRLADKEPTANGKRILYDPNRQAKEAFLSRKIKGMNLSDRIWKHVQGYRQELEAGILEGISEGRNSAQMASELKKHLKDPDKLFRRVRDSNGKLKLSRAAQAYHPGQGKYRSSFQNAMRLTTTETNMAYRSADHERWQSMPFVKGIEVKLSKNHEVFDICDSLVGKFPKDYIHVGFHPRCRCYSIPILMTDEEFAKHEDDILDGKPIADEAIGRVTDVHSGAKEWIRSNRDRIKGWASKPYWLKDNSKYLKGLLTE